MPDLTLDEKWVDGVPAIEITEPVEGGEDGVDNRAPKRLGNQAAALKNFVDDAFGPDWVDGVADPSAISLPPVHGAVLLGDGSSTVTVDATTSAVAASQHLRTDSAGVGTTENRASSDVYVHHDAEITSWSEGHLSHLTGDGGPHQVRSQQGATGHKSGDYDVGLPSGSGTLGAKHKLSVGQLVGNVSDPVIIDADGTTILKCYQSGAGVTAIESGGSSGLRLNAVSGNAVLLGQATVSISQSPGATVIRNTGYVQLLAATSLYETFPVEKQEGTFGAPSRVTIIGTTSLNVSGFTTLWSKVVPTGECWAVDYRLLVRNLSDNRVAYYAPASPDSITGTAIYRNVAGTLTEVDSPSLLGWGDAAELSDLNVGGNYSGVSPRLHITPATAKTRQLTYVVTIYRIL